MGLLEAICSTILPIFLGIFSVALLFTWCGKTENLQAGVKSVLNALALFFKDDKLETAPQSFQIEEREFVGFKNRVSEMFSYFVFICAKNFGDYLVVQYRVGAMQVEEDIIEFEWINFIKSACNIPAHIRIPILLVHNAEAGLLYLYYAWNENGIKTLKDIKSSMKSRMIPPMDDDIIC